MTIPPQCAMSRLGSADPLLDFLGWSPFRRESPVSDVLDFLGFPWILSSESRLFNGLRAIFAEAIFSRASPA
jgi:hypothetical protein